ncbi:nocturnin isoform X2 [Anthonomus grandis grandis]|uniref:nocturnin isoform X2 n=1 Tax=Anthonomus grandis grandis TaxID=2921223 RepID=UPI0021651B63|nr:nocturnin isoform X2 [Anthonomus grandis grandis]
MIFESEDIFESNCEKNSEDAVLKTVKDKIKSMILRMGSFNSSPKILNEDSQDDDVSLPKNISRNELLQYCHKRPYGQLMVKRAFKKARRSAVKNGEDAENLGIKVKKLNAVTEVCSDYTTSPQNLRVLQWNILSQALGKSNDNFVKCPYEALDWNHRRYLIVEEIVEYCPDIICLQEVDHFNFLKHVLGTQGYMGMFFPKPDSPCFYIHDNNGPDGCAIFYRSDKFDLLKADTRILEMWTIQSNQVALLMTLKLKETGEEICVATTHLKAKHSALLATLRNEQGKDLLEFLKQSCEGRPLILCGDFNAEPVEPVYNTVLQSKLNFASAYAECNRDKNDRIPSADREPPYTTWKVREEGEVCHTIDYVFYTKSKFEVEAVLEFPSGEEIGNGRVPSMSYPSDHFSLVCDFKIRTNSDTSIE